MNVNNVVEILNGVVIQGLSINREENGKLEDYKLWKESKDLVNLKGSSYLQS